MFVWKFKVKEYSRDELMLQFTGQKLSDMIQKDVIRHLQKVHQIIRN